MTENSEIAREVESRTIRIQLVDGTRINGQVNIKRTPGHDRVSDHITSNDDDFLVLFKATLYCEDITEPVRHPTIFVNKKHILYATPDETQM